MSTVLKKLSKIDDKTKFGVYGWIRKAEEELKLQHIPVMISSICILYFHKDEIFDIVGKDIKLSKDRKCIIKLSKDEWDNNCYGATEIQSDTDNIYQWDIVINKLRVSSGVRFGISSDTCLSGKSDIQYIQWGDGCEYDHVSKSWKYDNFKRFWVKQNDKISIILNLKTATMICRVDNGATITKIEHQNIRKIKVTILNIDSLHHCFL